MIDIIQKEHEVLRKIAKPVAIKEIKSLKIQKILANMKKAMDSQDDSVAIAAPQIGVSLRIFTVSKKVFKIPEKETSIEDKAKSTGDDKTPQDSTRGIENSEDDLVFINPEIIKLSKKEEELDEGCLSARWLYGRVKRSTNITIKAYNEKGVGFTRGAEGLLAQIFQHEIDHLNGILFTDKASDIEEILPEKI